MQKASQDVYLGHLENAKYPVMSPGTKVLGGFPSKVRVTLKYVDVISLDPAAASIDSHAFALRNLWDPDTQVGGHQPSNYDNWTRIFQRWTVLNVNVKMSNAINSTSSVTPGFWGFLISKDGLQVPAMPSVSALLEQPFVKYVDVPSSALVNIGAFPGSLTATIPCAPWLGVQERDLLIGEYTWIDGSGFPPQGDIYAEFFVATVAGNDPGAAKMKIELEFDCVFLEPNVTLPS